jgi:transmembrane sensor
MAIDENQIEQLVLDEIAGIITPEDSATLNHLLEIDPAARVLRDAIYAQFSGEAEQAFLALPPEALPIDKVFDRIRKRRWIRIYTRISYALLAALLIGGAAYIIFQPEVPTINRGLSPENVALQLPNGHTIPLGSTQQQLQVGDVQLQSGLKRMSYVSGGNSNEVSGTNNSKVSGGANSVVTLLVPPGKDYTIQLSDGTEIQLNAASRLRFPASFTGNTREITIDGEAYLKVASDERRPFILHLPQSTVRVLGTEFNVNTYDSGQVQVALVKGSVAFETPLATKQLAPGQLIESENMQISKFNADDLLAWRQGIYVFHATTVADMCKVVTRWFGVRVVYDSPNTGRRRFTGYMDRNQPMRRFLDDLQSTGDFDYYLDRDSVLHIR